MLPFPTINPVAFNIGPLSVRWYGLMYALGFFVCYWFINGQIQRKQVSITHTQLSDLLFVVFIGILFGGRIGYVLGYQFAYFIEQPLRIFALWEGGMSFHGGLLGVIIAILIYAHIQKISPLRIADSIITPIPLALAFGRLGNFINGELYGKAAEVPWCMVFPAGGDICRHPSQLYQFAGEGILLFLILLFIQRRTPKTGTLFASFLIGYALFRSLVELFREPDQHIGLLWNFISMGQLLSLPLLIAGIILLIFINYPRPRHHE